MRQRVVYRLKSNPEYEFYKMNVEIIVNKKVFDKLVELYGDNKAVEFVKRQFSNSYNWHPSLYHFFESDEMDPNLIPKLTKLSEGNNGPEIKWSLDFYGFDWFEEEELPV